MIEQIPGVSKVIVQNEIMYDSIFETIKPDYIVHGDNWNEPAMQAIHNNIIELTEKYGGKLVEIPYTFNESVHKKDKQMIAKLAMPEFRRGRLRKLLKMIPLVKTIEFHSGLTGLIAEKTVVADLISL